MTHATSKFDPRHPRTHAPTLPTPRYLADSKFCHNASKGYKLKAKKAYILQAFIYSQKKHFKKINRGTKFTHPYAQ